MDVLSLLKSKNRCLERMTRLSAEFAASAENGDLSGLDSFTQRRDKILRAMELYDRKTTEVVAALPPVERTSELVEQVEALLEAKNALIHRILQLDKRVIAAIEGERDRVQNELNATRKSRDAMSKFKSSWIPESGEGLDETL